MYGRIFLSRCDSYLLIAIGAGADLNEFSNKSSFVVSWIRAYIVTYS
jgi:hypothetical protein